MGWEGWCKRCFSCGFHNWFWFVKEKQLLRYTVRLGSVGEEYAEDSDSGAEVDRPPRIGLRFRVHTAVVHLASDRISVAVDRVRRRELPEVDGVVESTAHERRPVECHVHIETTVHCNRGNDAVSSRVRIALTRPNRTKLNWTQLGPDDTVPAFTVYFFLGASQRKL